MHDLLAGYSSEEDISRIYDELGQRFGISWMGDVKFFLVLEIRRSNSGIYELSAKRYIGTEADR